MRGTEGGNLDRAFIGRHDEREHIKTKLLQDGLLLLFGQPLVGKASLALQVAEELQAEEECVPTDVYTVDCTDASNWPDIMCNICRAFSLEETVATNENSFSRALVHRVPSNGKGRLVLLLLRVHGLLPSGTGVRSMARCLTSLARNNNVITVVTSRRKLLLPTVKRINPMTLRDAVQLLRHQAPDVSAEDFAELVENHCHGLPPLVLQMSQLVSGDPLVAYSAAELRQELEEDPGLLMQGLEEEAQLAFYSLSPEVQGHVSTLAGLLDGQFSLEALQAAVGVEKARSKMVLRKLCDETPLIIDQQSQRMRLEPLVLHHVRNLGHVTADDQARLRVVVLLGSVLTRAGQELYVQSDDTVYGHLHGDWPQLQHVLRQAIHCTNNTYQAYLQVALKADRLLAKCFPQEALQFYRNMARAAVHFGTARDTAVLQGLIGMAITCGQGTGWDEAVQYFHRALPVLQKDGPTLLYMRLLCDLGLVYFRLNHLKLSEKYLKEAVSISDFAQYDDEQEHIFYLLRARSLRVLPAIFRGYLDKSKDILLETLELCEQYAPNHPDKAVLINSLGLFYERSEKDQNKALHYYEQSLVVRRRYASVAPGDMVPTLNNTGMQYNRRGHYDMALVRLEEAAAIRARDSRWHYHTALTEQHIGLVCIHMGDYSRAERHLLEAACIYSRCTPQHDVRGKVALCLAHVYLTPALYDAKQVRRYLQQVCQLVEEGQGSLSDGGLQVLLTAVQHRVQLQGWHDSRGLSSVLRWAQQLIAKFDGDRCAKLTTHQLIIDDLVNMLRKSSLTEAEKGVLRDRIAAQCQMCEALSLTQDTNALWQQVEQRGEELRSAIDRLKRSEAILNDLSSSQSPLLKEATTLSSEQQSRGEATAGPHPPKMGGKGSILSDHSVQDQEEKLQNLQEASQHCLVTSGGLSVCLHSLPVVEESRRGVALPGAEEDRQERTYSQQQTIVVGAEGGVGQQLQQQQIKEQVSDGQKEGKNRGRCGYGCRLGQNPVVQQSHDLLCSDQGQAKAAERLNTENVGNDISSHFPELPRFTDNRNTNQTTVSREPSFYPRSSCSFTSSEPPSSSNLDGVSSRGLNSGLVPQQQDVVTLCERLIFPQQETARDQSIPSSNIDMTQAVPWERLECDTQVLPCPYLASAEQSNLPGQVGTVARVSHEEEIGLSGQQTARPLSHTGSRVETGACMLYSPRDKSSPWFPPLLPVTADTSIHGDCSISRQMSDGAQLSQQAHLSQQAQLSQQPQLSQAVQISQLAQLLQSPQLLYQVAQLSHSVQLSQQAQLSQPAHASQLVQSLQASQPAQESKLAPCTYTDSGLQPQAAVSRHPHSDGQHFAFPPTSPPPVEEAAPTHQAFFSSSPQTSPLAGVVSPVFPELASPDTSNLPPTTLQDMAVRLQQLLASLPHADLVTSEQRMALEKLTSLTVQNAENSAAREALFDEQSLGSLISRGDQAAKLASHRSQHSQDTDQSQPRIHPSHPSPTSDQWQPGAQPSAFHALHQSGIDTQTAGTVQQTTTTRISVTTDQAVALDKLSGDIQQPQTAPQQYSASRIIRDQIAAERFPGLRKAGEPESHTDHEEKPGSSTIPAYGISGVTRSPDKVFSDGTQFPATEFHAFSETGHDKKVKPVKTSARLGTPGGSSALPGSNTFGFNPAAGRETGRHGFSAAATTIPSVTDLHHHQRYPLQPTAVPPRAGREPTESDDSEDPLLGLGSMVAGTVTQTTLSPQPLSGRQATEYDERLDNPNHVCVSADCCCSLQNVTKRT